MLMLLAVVSSQELSVVPKQFIEDYIRVKKLDSMLFVVEDRTTGIKTRLIYYYVTANKFLFVCFLNCVNICFKLLRLAGKGLKVSYRKYRKISILGCLEVT